MAGEVTGRRRDSFVVPETKGRSLEAAHTAAGIDVAALAARLRADPATSFVESWNDLLEIIDRQSAARTA